MVVSAVKITILLSVKVIFIGAFTVEKNTR
jgi:hypothetical protein